MGQHKYNPTAEKAKNGELPPKKKKMGKRESERFLMRKLQERLWAFGMGGKYFDGGEN